MCANLISLGDENTFKKMLSLLLSEIQKKIALYEKDKTDHNYFLIKNYVIFFMIITINLKKFTSFVLLIFKGNINFFKNLILSINTIKKKKKREELLSIVNYLFLEEYRELYFPKEGKGKENNDEILEKIFVGEQLSFSTMNLSISSYDDNAYSKIIDILLKFDISYDNFFKYYQKIDLEDRSDYKLQIAQSIIRVAFSKEKYNFTKEKNYEYKFIKRVIEKDAKETYEKDNNFRTLLRKEDLCDDVIKYIFFIFGNSMLIQSFVKPVKKLLKKLGVENEDNNNSEINEIEKILITVDDFNTLFDEMVTGLYESMPHVIKILLKIFYTSVRKLFSVKENDFNALYTALFFNFILNPRTQALYGICSHKNQYVKDINKLIWKAIYYNKSDESESAAIFNESIEINHKKIANFIKKKIISINENDEEVKNSLNDLFTEKYLIYPNFLFYVDSSLLCGTIQGGKEKIIHFQEIEIKKK